MSKVGVRKASVEGRLPHSTTASGQRLYHVRDLDAYMGRTPETVPAKPRVEAWYTRVSGSTGQESSFDTQEQELRSTSSGALYRVYRDQASGLNERRAELTRLLKDAADGHFTVVRVTHKDRLSRFGVLYLEQLLAMSEVKLEVVNERSSFSGHEELMQDFMSLLASFAGRFYRLRSRDHQQKLLNRAIAHLEHTEELVQQTEEPPQ
ncbi:putative site-specific integrase-resolvase [Deinococcus sp. UYEF24]